MANLRKKIEAAPEHPAFLRTESGIGYRFVDAGRGDALDSPSDSAPVKYAGAVFLKKLNPNAGR